VRALRTAIAFALAASTSVGAEERSPEIAAARSRQIAVILGLESFLERVESAPSGTRLEDRLDRLQLRDEMLSELQRLSFLIDATVARIEQEHSAAAGARSFLEGGYTRAVTNWNIAAVLVGNGLAIVGTALQFDGSAQAFAGDGVVLGGAAIATAFSIVALTRKDQGRTPHAIETNFLSALLGRTPTPDSVLPAPVLRYLEVPLAGEPGSLRSQLMEQWMRRGSIPRTESRERRQKIDLLTRPLWRREVVSADVLADRAEMLADLRSRVAGMHVDLQRLMREVRARPAMQ
jgi:hypothetical protein